MTPVFSKPKFDRGDRLRVNDGTFAGMEGEVKEINQEKGTVKLQLTHLRSARRCRSGVLASGEGVR